MSYNIHEGGEHRDECEEGRDQELLEESQYEADAGKRADEYRRALAESRDDLILISKSCWDSVRKIDDLITKLESP